MANVNAVRLTGPVPLRLDVLYRVRLLPALIAGSAAAFVLLAVYYLTLGLLPPASSYPAATYPFPAWAHRFDISQFLGTIPFPPIPTALTWWVGLAIWFGTLAGTGLVYAILLSWTLQPSDAIKGAGFGGALFFVLTFGLTLAQGYHPAVMRNELPDVGLFLLGWSVWATAQLAVAFALYGATLGAVYRRLSID